jgi:hypothetical protein
LKASNKRAFNSRLNGAELGLGLLMKASTAILVMQLYGRVPNIVQDDGLVIGDIADLEVAHDVAYPIYSTIPHSAIWENIDFPRSRQ